MIGTIGFIDVTTARAGARGVARVNLDHGHTHQLRLVLDKGSQLVERPAMQRCSLRLSSPYPVTDALEVFQGDTPTGAFSLSNDAFADLVVDIGSKAALFTRQLAQTTTARLCSFALEFLAQATMAVTNVRYRLALVDFTRAVSGDIGHAQVNTKKVFDILWRRLVNFAGGQQVELATNQAQVGLATLAAQQFLIPLATDERDSLATVYRPDGNLVFIEFPRQDADIVGNRAVRLEGAPRPSIPLVGVRHFGNTADDNLRSQVEGGTHVTVDKFLKLKLAEGASVPSYLTDVVTGFVCYFKGALQAVGLCIGRLKFRLRRQLHTRIVAYRHYSDKFRVGRNPSYRWRAFLPPLKQVGFLPERIVISILVDASTSTARNRVLHAVHVP